MTEDNLIRIHHRLDDIQESLTKIEISQGIYGNLQDRFEGSLKDINSILKMKVDVAEFTKFQDKLHSDIDHIYSNCESGKRGIDQYKGDRKFVLGIVATITVLFGSINGIALKLVTGYFDEIDKRFEKMDSKIRSNHEQLLFDTTRLQSNQDDLKDRLNSIKQNVKGN